jgi:hypothetical protein
MSELPIRYRLVNFLIRWTGRKFAEDHMGHWRPKVGGGVVYRAIPLGRYSLRTRAEALLRPEASNIERFAARNGIDLKPAATRACPHYDGATRKCPDITMGIKCRGPCALAAREGHL